MKIILKYDEIEINGRKVQLDNLILPSIVRWVQNEKEKVAACNFKTGIATYQAYKYETKTGTKVVNIDIESISKEEE